MINLEKFTSLDIILASKSPRRQALLKEMGLTFRVAIKDVDESYPTDLEPGEVAEYIACKKANAFELTTEEELIIAADTIVCVENRILGKPKDEQDAFQMICSLSGRSHEVITGVALASVNDFRVFHEKTTVYFHSLSEDEIWYYIHQYKPFDKAGAYGIQEWIGAVGIDRIAGSYNNVVGLPTDKLYREIVQMLPL
ncbi:Maf family protein [Olivibacter sitiensis]|uniref:Maf family protein n=1 Tax=Olivibacter sitiensis TaxID=376470 RepID=UPI00040A5575|nr:Maf family protein [Olivibacter sitiensis]